MGNDYTIEFTPPTTEEIMNARPPAMILPQDALTYAMLIAATLCSGKGKKMIVSCRKAGAQSLPNILDTSGLG